MHEIWKATKDIKIINGILIFESCEEKVPKLKRSIDMAEKAYGNNLKKSGICVLTGCRKTTKKVNNRREMLESVC